MLRRFAPPERQAELAGRVQRQFVALVRRHSARHAGSLREIAGARRLFERPYAAPGYDFIAVGGGVEHDTAFGDLRDTEAILARLGVARVGA